MNGESRIPEPQHDGLDLLLETPSFDEELGLDALAAPRPHRRDVRALDEEDEGWIASLLDLVERSLGEPWRILEERASRSALATNQDVRSILVALKRIVGGRSERIRVARALREKILGVPALDTTAREERIAAAAEALGIAANEVEALLWADLARERPVTLPRGRPQPLQLAALANLERVQAAVRRAQEIRIELRDDANELIRTAARYGLLASARRAETTTILQVAGPLALFHATAVYGRALSALVPLLAEHEWLSFEIVEPVRDAQQAQSVYLLPPLLLPPVPLAKRRKPTVGQRLARRLLDAGFEIQREPPPIASPGFAGARSTPEGSTESIASPGFAGARSTPEGGFGRARSTPEGSAESIAHGEDLLFPELAILDAATGQRWFVEVVGFSTDAYLAHKLAAYDLAHDPNIILCVDAERSPHVTEGARDRIVPFRRQVELEVLLAAMRGRGGAR